MVFVMTTIMLEAVHGMVEIVVGRKARTHSVMNVCVEIVPMESHAALAYCPQLQAAKYDNGLVMEFAMTAIIMRLVTGIVGIAVVWKTIISTAMIVHALIVNMIQFQMGVDSVQRGCGYPLYQGDGICDTANNVAGCDWDSGDCCGSDNDYRYCGEDCMCLDCTYENPSDECTDSIVGVCGIAQFVSDSFCDDQNNNAGCAWDGGDCCDPDASRAFCNECMCKDCTVNLSDECVDNINGYCDIVEYQGDGFCDPGNNNAGCSWDGGDCCGSTSSLVYCTSGEDCECRDCTFEDNCNGGECVLSAWKGDGFCDDGNNNCGCGWDGGDCCNSDSNFDYCSDCTCLDPTKQPDGTCVGACWNFVFAGDGFCDDSNNVCACDWDGGDCCIETIISTYCEDCACLDPEVAS